MSVVIETTAGDITFDLFTDCRPRTCMNFLKLCKMKYYNFNLIFSVERNFIAQMGDPTASGKGGECIYSKMFGDKAKFYEGEKLPIMKHTELGTVSMVSCGNNLFGSQFFITLGENLDSLDVEHLVFGQVVEGMDVLSKLNQTLTDERNRPYQDIRITHTVILDDPYPDPKEVEFPSESPRPTMDILESDYIAADESVDDTEGKSITEIQEEIEEREATARATILEMVGDLPESDMAPPENVLFVCKLNPVTTSDDLEIIFSRFGKIKSCEVIRDRLTDNSLQYAFIEFAETKSCEDAYFKMDNVLIDDRRIHVDFSQSVSKIKWRGKGKGVEYFDDDGRKVEGRKGFNPNKDNRSGPKRNNRPHEQSGLHSRHTDRRFHQEHTEHRRSHQEHTEHRRSHQEHTEHRRFHQEPTEHRRFYQDNTHQRKGMENRSMSNYRRYDEERTYPQGRENEKRMLKHNGHKADKETNSNKRESDKEKHRGDKEEMARLLMHLKKDMKKRKRKKKDKKYSDSDTDSSREAEKKRSKKKKKLSESEDDSDDNRKKKKKRKKRVSESEDSDSEDKKKKRKKKKKRVSESEDSDSDDVDRKKKKRKLTESEDSSESDSEPKKAKKSKKKKKKKKKKKETYTSSSSDSP